MKPKHLLFITFLLAGFTAISQNVTNIKAQLSGQEIVVNYNIGGAKFNQEFTVSLFISRDNGKTWQGPLKEVSGDVGSSIKSGAHSITWDMMKEIPMTGEELIFDVRAVTVNMEIKKAIFVQYVGNLTTPAGVRAGMLGKTGFYIEGRFSPGFNQQSSYTYTGDLIDDYNKPGYYQFSGNTTTAAMSALAGITFQPAWNTFLYIGAGYGTQKYLAEINEYSYEGNTQTATNWAESATASYSGVELDAGVMYRVGKVVVSAGGTALNFKVFNFTAGIGVAF
jgi:hypothetical protein